MKKFAKSFMESEDGIHWIRPHRVLDDPASINFGSSVIDEGPNFALRRFIMEPGGGMPNHTNTVEHEQYVLRGRAEIGIGDEVFNVKQGDVVFIPGGTPHWYKAMGEEPFEFLCIVPNGPDTITILDA